MDAKIIEVKADDPKITDTPQHITFYSNLAQIMISNEEVIIRFGLREPDNPQSASGVATAYLSPAHAKRLAFALSRSIGQYEKNFGEIIADPLGKLTPEQLEKIGISKDAK